jgi:hypothetical protein
MLKQVQHEGPRHMPEIWSLAPQHSKLVGGPICERVTRAAYTHPFDQAQANQEAAIGINGLLHGARPKQLTRHFQFRHSGSTLNKTEQSVRNIGHQ